MRVADERGRQNAPWRHAVRLRPAPPVRLALGAAMARRHRGPPASGPAARPTAVVGRRRTTRLAAWVGLQPEWFVPARRVALAERRALGRRLRRSIALLRRRRGNATANPVDCRG